MRKVCNTTFQTDTFKVSRRPHILCLRSPTRTPRLTLVCARTLTPVCTPPRAQESMRKCFISVGLVKDDKGAFKKYVNHRRGSMAIKRVDTPHDTCLGELATELEMVQRAGVDSDDEAARRAAMATMTTRRRTPTMRRLTWSRCSRWAAAGRVWASVGCRDGWKRWGDRS